MWNKIIVVVFFNCTLFPILLRFVFNAECNVQHVCHYDTITQTWPSVKLIRRQCWNIAEGKELWKCYWGCKIRSWITIAAAAAAATTVPVCCQWNLGQLYLHPALFSAAVPLPSVISLTVLWCTFILEIFSRCSLVAFFVWLWAIQCSSCLAVLSLFFSPWVIESKTQFVFFLLARIAEHRNARWWNLFRLWW